MAIHQANHEAELVDAEPGPSSQFIFASIDAWMLMHHVGPTRLARIVLIAIGRDDDGEIL
jgi:hypothetical protein